MKLKSGVTKKIIYSAVALTVVPLFFQNCGGVNLKTPSEQARLSSESQLTGTICYPYDVSVVSNYSLSDFYVVNLTARKFNGQLIADSDMDGQVDSILVSSEATVAVSDVDSDQDGIPDFIEILKGTNPNLNDVDQDGVDLDGVINKREIQLGTDPQFSGDVPTVEYTIQPVDPVVGCGQGQSAYQFHVDKIVTVPTKEFSDPVNSGANSLSHAANENVILVLARLSPMNTSNPDVFMSKIFKINMNAPLQMSFAAVDFSVFGQSDSTCTEGCGNAAGHFYTKVYSGKKHSCAITTAKTVYCWGDNANGQIGDRSTLPRLQATAVEVPELVNEMALGASHTCAMTQTGAVYCWGKNNFGQLGLNSSVDSDHPEKVPLPDAAAGLSAGVSHTCAVLANNQLWCWGQNNKNQLANGTTENSLIPVRAQVPAQVGFPIKNISLGGDSSCLSDKNGSAFCWGSVGGSCAQPVIQKLPNACMPSQITSFLKFNQIVTNGAFVGGIIVRSPSNGVTCWAWGGGSKVSEIAASPCGSLEGEAGASIYMAGITQVSKISMGARHACALKKGAGASAASAIDCWGENLRGQIAQDFSASNPIPQSVSGVKDPIDVSSGDEFSCGLDKNGVLYCWGINNYGQLGTGDITNNYTPQKVKGQ